MSKEGQSRRSFRLKVEAIEKAVRENSIPSDIPTLRRIQDVRDWNAPPLTAWVSYSVAAPKGPNADLRARLDAVFPTFVQRQNGTLRKGVRAPSHADPGEWLASRERDVLLIQNAELLAQVDELNARVRLLQHEREALRATEARLQATITKTIGLRSV